MTTNVPASPQVDHFDYTTLPSDIAALAMKAADKVRAHQRRTVSEIIDVGVELLQVKQHLDHGRFGRWLDLEFGWTMRTAQNYMRAGAVFKPKSETVSHLPTATVYLLSSKNTPPTIVNSVVTRLEAGERIHPDRIKTEVIAAVRKAREEQRKQSRAAARQNRKQRQDAEEKRRQKAEKERAEREAIAFAKAQELVQQFGLETVQQIACALDDWTVRDALRTIAIAAEGGD